MAQQNIKLELNEQNTCSVNLFGATLTSWVCQGEERLFLSSKAVFDNKKAIRGGIPVVFPNFGPWTLGPAHGFARIKMWTIEQIPTKNNDGGISAVLVLKDDEETRKMWDFKFQLTYTVTLRDGSLDTSLSISNNSTESFEYTTLLHTYFKVPNIKDITVSGLKGLQYVDKVEDMKTSTEERDLVTIAANVDRVYVDTPKSHTISNTMKGQELIISKENFTDTVVWNPWAEKAAAMGDLEDDSYWNFVCVEVGRVASPSKLEAGQSINMSQTFSIASAQGKM